MKTITLTEEQYSALMQGEVVTIEPPKPKQWRPKGGDWYVTRYGIVGKYCNSEKAQDFGTLYKTEEQAVKARDAMRKHNRLLAWLAENDDGWDADWDNDDKAKWSVHYKHISKSYETVVNYSVRSLGTVYMSQNNAEKLAKLLNDGVVKL